MLQLLFCVPVKAPIFLESVELLGPLGFIILKQCKKQKVNTLGSSSGFVIFKAPKFQTFMQQTKKRPTEMGHLVTIRQTPIWNPSALPGNFFSNFKRTLGIGNFKYCKISTISLREGKNSCLTKRFFVIIISFAQ